MQATRWKPKRGLAGLALLGLAACSPAPQPDPAEWISAERLARHVRELADDAYEGRSAGYAGEVLATQYIARRFESFGLEPAGDLVGNRHSWFQAFEFSPLRPPVAGETLHSRNVVALLHGTELADEIVVLGAHHDGVGRPGQADPGRRPASDESFAEDEIWNGASDNATSVAALLEIAGAWKASGFHPRRTVVFVTFGAEEHGLVGSTRYVEAPPLPWKRHVAMINLEKLVGDLDAELLTASSGTSPAFDVITASAGQAAGFEITPFYPGIVRDTDHYPFAARGLPAMVIGTGSAEHIDEPGDEADRLDYAALEARTRFVHEFVVEAANWSGAFEYTGNVEGFPGVLGGPATPDELAGTGPARTAGFKVISVIPGLPGDRAGLRPGDIVLGVSGVPFESVEVFYLDELVAGTDRPNLQVARPGDSAVITIELH